MTIPCPNCAKTLKVADGAAGKIICCPACENVFEMPLPEEELVAAELVEPEPESSAITEKPAPPARKAAWDDDEPPAKSKKSPSEDEDADELYGLDAADADERDDRERTRELKEKRRRSEDEEDRRRSHEPHQGVLLLVLSIVAMCGACLCAIIGWGFAVAVLGMANTDLAKMDSRVMDPSGRPLTTAAKACAIIAVGLGLANCILGIAMTINLSRMR